MSTTRLWKQRPWALDKPLNNFGLPRGLRGRLAGLVMYWGNRPHQRELLDQLDVRSGDHILDVGYGPGWMVRTLAEGGSAARVAGVDPSKQMRRMAMRRNRAGIASGRVRLELGTAEDTGFADASFDHVLSVNNLALWPDLEAALRELRRVLRPGGVLAMSWHSSTAPDSIQRSLGLPEHVLSVVSRDLEQLFDEVRRRDLPNTVCFLARRPR
ncbi:ubiquinone/menaquinone biosynthesis C-methylase UbiE [Actinopolyspora biskrensis]|uniref:Ubiquinone/menaquinone biosynthesis C-methylase UbiE n=1 Tax=Actinopolyspora biskrensis TaxID=1470178 RepID=A0A852Z4J6_9ACTN|nr:class I SAM-dependent methyltransferase [Actinopolyspora biskrensis]NYH77277.1 ubiquinone/menaquinone biosynthesis C-methylase UbiE [Actinopolyspora biskrensis]